MDRGIRIVIPGDDPPQLQGSPHLERLKEYGEVTMYLDRPATSEEKVRRCKDADCLINSRSAIKWPGDVLRQLPRLKMITVCGIGTDAIDLEAARKQNIVVCNIPGRTAPIVAEHAIALMFAVARRAWLQTQNIKQGRWIGIDNVFLRGKTLGVVGTGSIGAEIARLGKAVGMKVLAWTFHPTSQRAADLGLSFVSLDDLLKQSDVISVSVKLTDETRGLLDRHKIAQMKPGAILINTARGAIVDNVALAEALNAGRLAGAGVDVFEVEPVPKDHPLVQCEHVVLTPHNADQTPEGVDILNVGVVENIIAFLEGRPQNRVV